MGTGVRELTTGFNLIQDEKGITATRVYVYDTDDVDSNEDVPKIGDELYFPFGAVPVSYALPPQYEKIYCRRVEFGSLEGHPDKFSWTCTYSNEPVDDVAVYNSDETPVATPWEDLPINFEFGGEYTLITPKDDNTDWIWTDLTAVEQPIPFRVGLSTLRVSRVVLDTNYPLFQTNCGKALGKVNIGGPTGSPFSTNYGCWLFTGVNTEIYRDYNNNKKWRAELTFQFRDPDNLQIEGWNKLLKLSGVWDVPYNTVLSRKLYPMADFTGLFDDTVVPITP